MAIAVPCLSSALPSLLGLGRGRQLRPSASRVGRDRECCGVAAGTVLAVGRSDGSELGRSVRAVRLRRALIDTAGYLGAALSGYAVGRLVDARGWAAAFQLLALVAAGSAVAATVYWYRQHSKRSAAC